jgi:hypothetical protein
MFSIAMIFGIVLLLGSAGIILYDFIKTLYKYLTKHKNKQKNIW